MRHWPKKRRRCSAGIFSSLSCRRGWVPQCTCLKGPEDQVLSVRWGVSHEIQSKQLNMQLTFVKDRAYLLHREVTTIYKIMVSRPPTSRLALAKCHIKVFNDDTVTMKQSLHLCRRYSEDTNCDDRVSYTEFVKWLFHGSSEACSLGLARAGRMICQLPCIAF